MSTTRRCRKSVHTNAHPSLLVYTKAMIAEIVSVAHNNVIGKNNDFEWYLSDDLRRFRRLTTGHKIIMGRKNYEHLLGRTKGKLLPDRTSIVVTRNPDYRVLPGAMVVCSLQEALALVEPDEDAFVVGGAQIYEQALPFADRLYITEVDADMDGGDAFYPALDPTQWREVSRESHVKDHRNEHDYTFVVLDRVK